MCFIKKLKQIRWLIYIFNIFANMDTSWIKAIKLWNFESVYVLVILKRLKRFGSPITIHVWSFEASIKSIGTLRSALAYNLLGMDEGFNIHFFKVTFLHQVYFCSIHLTITLPSISNLKTGPIQFNILN